MGTELDGANRVAWGSRPVAEIFVRREGFIEPAEAAMVKWLAHEVRDQPILDIGVGGGRTTPLLRSISADYVGIDYLENLVESARMRYPEARFEHMDARDLSAFGDGAFGLVLFSLNGIDGMAHADRPAVLSEAHRVLRPGGLFAYATMNRDYRNAGHRSARSDWRLALRRPVRALLYALRLPRLSLGRRRLGALAGGGEDWATFATLAYGSPVIWHQITLAGALRELAEAGFGTVEAFGPSGVGATFADADARAAAEQDTGDWPSLYLVARKGL